MTLSYRRGFRYGNKQITLQSANRKSVHGVRLIESNRKRRHWKGVGYLTIMPSSAWNRSNFRGALNNASNRQMTKWPNNTNGKRKFVDDAQSSAVTTTVIVSTYQCWTSLNIIQHVRKLSQASNSLERQVLQNYDNTSLRDTHFMNI